MKTQDLWQQLDDRLIQTLQQCYPELPERLVQQLFFTPPKDSVHGDLACHAAMVLAKPLRQAPRVIAQTLVETLVTWLEIESAEIAGPGFINIRLSTPSLCQQSQIIVQHPQTFSHSDIGAGQKVNVEYVSVNPTGPLHVGHARGAVFGDALSSLLQRIGFAVTREYYINDAGVQIDILARSVYKRYLQALGDVQQTFDAPLYPGEYLIPCGEGLAQQHGAALRGLSEVEWMPVVRPFAIEQMMTLIKADLAALGVNQDIFSSEDALVKAGAVKEAVQVLDDMGLLYRGVLESPRGKKPEDWEPREQLLFRSSDFGDDIDRPLIKSDGTHSYFTPDITYHRHKVQRGFGWLINVFGADHIGYVKRLKAAVKAFSDVRFDILCTQIVRFMENGAPVRMSKRAGTFVALSDLIDRVGKDVVRLHLLGRKNDAHMDFDLELVVQQSLDNPVFYIQYAHARCYSAITHAKQAFPDHDFSANPVLEAQHLGSSLDRQLMVKLMEYPMLLRRAGMALEVHRLPLYLRELSKELHSYWNQGRDQAELRVVVRDNLAVTQARVQLMQAVKTVLADGLHLLGVQATDELR